MELEAEPLPEAPVQVPSLEPTVPPPEETVSRWSEGQIPEKWQDFQGSACHGALSPLGAYSQEKGK